MANHILREIRRLFAQAELTANGGTVTYDRDIVSTGKPTSAHLHMGDDLPEAVWLERFFARAIEVAEHTLAGRRKINPADSRSDLRKATRRAILAARGCDPVAVAFLYGVSERTVQRIRAEAGQDTQTGVPAHQAHQERIDGQQVKPRPLTAPPEAALEQYEHKEGTVDSSDEH